MLLYMYVTFVVFSIIHVLLPLQDGWSPVMCSSSEEHVKCVEVQLEMSAQVNQEGNVSVVVCLHVQYSSVREHKLCLLMVECRLRSELKPFCFSSDWFSIQTNRVLPCDMTPLYTLCTTHWYMHAALYVVSLRIGPLCIYCTHTNTHKQMHTHSYTMHVAPYAAQRVWGLVECPTNVIFRSLLG